MRVLNLLKREKYIMSEIKYRNKGKENRDAEIKANNLDTEIKNSERNESGKSAAVNRQP